MPFIDSSNTLPTRMHLGSSKVVGASIALVALAAVVLAAFNVVQMGAHDDLVLVKSSSANESPSSSSEGADGAQQTEGAPADAGAALADASAGAGVGLSSIFVYVSSHK